MRTLAIVLALTAGCGGGATPARRGTTMRQLPPANPEAVNQFAAGVRFMKQGPEKYGEAMRRFAKAVTIDPNLWEAHYDIGYLHEHEGDLAKAAKAYRTALGIQPGYRPNVVRLGEVLVRG